MKIKEIGSFHVGGREFNITGKPVREIVLNEGGIPAKYDPNGTLQVEQMYTQFFIPEDQKGKWPLLLWHGTWLTGVTYETTPDGREGWLNYFLKKGWAVYNSDAVERGRSGWAPYGEIYESEPIFPTKEFPFEKFFHIGQGEGSYGERKVLHGNRFPVEAYEAFAKQLVPSWGAVTNKATLQAYKELVKKVGPSVLLAHSQGGSFAFQVAEALPEMVKAIIAVEPARAGNMEYAHQLRDIPVLVLYGDYFEGDARWSMIREKTSQYFHAVKQEGGSVDSIDLPNLGIRGNSHMLMMDRNNLEIADLIQGWLVKKSLYRI